MIGAETPVIATAQYCSAPLRLEMWSSGSALTQMARQQWNAGIGSVTLSSADAFEFGHHVHNQQKMEIDVMSQTPATMQQTPATMQQTPATLSGRRYVRVLIADPDPNVPNDKALLYPGSEMFTDLTDTELFFEIGIQAILAAHNAYRSTLPNKSIKDRTVMLEPVRVRDLQMRVVEIARF